MTADSNEAIVLCKRSDQQLLKLKQTTLTDTARFHLLSTFLCTLDDRDFFTYPIEELVRILGQPRPLAAALEINGGRSLFLAAWFPDVVRRRNISPEYYVDVARTSYALAAHHGGPLRLPYYRLIDAELSNMYGALCAIRPVH